jgi:adenine-specific DNA-methyltransferase
MQRSFISKLLTAANHDGAIVAFYTDNEPRWRLSYIRLDYEFAAGRAKMSLTPAKRYSYLVGEKEPCHTAMEQLYPIFRDENFNPTLDKIEEAFSVERVTQEFFDKYKEKYFILKEHLDGDDVFRTEAERHGFTSEQFAKKLMGQLAFLYFLQKKGWLGVKALPHVITEKAYKNAYYRTNATKEIIPKIYKQTGADEYKLVVSALLNLSDAEADAAAGCFKSEGWGSGTKTFIRDLFTSCKSKNFFEEYLEPLFYEALNQKRGENSYYKRFNCRIPFLNGGLFEPLENYDWKHCKFSIPNEVFSNIDTKGERDADGILDIFDRYNFTMNEDEPLEREVAVDPEMLAKF